MTKASEIESYSTEVRRSYESGDRRALLRMIWLCALYRWPAPEWAATAFDVLYRAALEGEIYSWNDVFGRPAAEPSVERQPRERRFEIWGKVRQIVEEEGGAITPDLFTRVGRELKIQDSVVAHLYQEVDRAVRAIKG